MNKEDEGLLQDHEEGSAKHTSTRVLIIGILKKKDNVWTARRFAAMNFWSGWLAG